MNSDQPQTVTAPSGQSVDAALNAANTAMSSRAAAQSAPPAHVGDTPAEAAEGDRIELEWVTKTKQILLATHNDPYEQARQLASLKADYMRKRYNKEIKLGE